jgi:hypothetical protein
MNTTGLSPATVKRTYGADARSSRGLQMPHFLDLGRTALPRTQALKSHRAFGGKGCDEVGHHLNIGAALEETARSYGLQLVGAL